MKSQTFPSGARGAAIAWPDVMPDVMNFAIPSQARVTARLAALTLLTTVVLQHRDASAKPPLPAGVNVSPEAAAIRARSTKIHRHFKRYDKRAASPSAMAAHAKKKAARAAEETKRARKLGDLVATHGDDRGILILLAGPDGAGKSSTIRRIEAGLDGVRSVRVEYMGAPPAGFDDVHWLKRHIDAMPKKGEVAIFDRTYLGRKVYGEHYKLTGTQDIAKVASEINHLEGLFAGRVIIEKFLLDIGADRQAKTVAKRERFAPERIDDADYFAHKEHSALRKLYHAVAAETQTHRPWHTVSMDDRKQGRMKIIKTLQHDLRREYTH